MRLFSVACVTSARELMLRVRTKARCDFVLALGVRKHFQRLGRSICCCFHFHRDINTSTSGYSEHPCDADATLLPVSEPRWCFRKLGKPGQQSHLPYCQGALPCCIASHFQTPKIPRSPKVREQIHRSQIQLLKIQKHQWTNQWDVAMILAS